MSLFVIGLNHNTADVDVREKLSIPEYEIGNVVIQICKDNRIEACVIISTCNRTEFYYSSDNKQLAIDSFCKWFGLDYDSIKQHIYIKSKLECVQHLYKVSAGLDSMILGEAQILGQVKSSYEITKDNKALDTTTDRLFQSAFRVAKSVRSSTDIGKNPVSIANSAVNLSKQIFGDLTEQSILMIGAGSTAELLLRYLAKNNYKQLAIANRNLNNAENLAQQFQGLAFQLDFLHSKISDYDLIFTATASKEPLIDSEMIKAALQKRKHKPMVIIDIAIPRDVDKSVKKFNDVFYYEVDDLQKVISKNLQNRELAAIEAEKIIIAEAEIFMDWYKSQQHTQLIHNFQRETARIRKESLDKALNKISSGGDIEDVLFYLANNLTKKLNHTPVKAIRNAIQSGDTNKINTIKELFNIDQNNDT